MTQAEPFASEAYRVVRKIPRGKVVTYGQVAELAGRPRAARAVGRALSKLPEAMARTVPWWRVVAASGKIPRRRDVWSELQRETLDREGVRFSRGGTIDLRRYGWLRRGRRPAGARGSA